MRDAAFVKRLPVAHRGLHDGNNAVWENTLSAFKRAVDAGYAIECDLQYVADAVPVVFHDDDMERLLKIKGDVRDKSSGELSLMSIGGTTDKVPTLMALLDLVKGKVPLVIELKGREGDDEGFAASVLEILEGYKGEVALMSFDHHILKDLAELESPYPIGLTAEGVRPVDFEAHRTAMAYGLDFISYCVMHLPNGFIEEQRKASVPVITWTVRNKAQADHSYAHADQITFEGFDPSAEGTTA
jgi:glycerophosphoryl diester phosphodiesterase